MGCGVCRQGSLNAESSDGNDGGGVGDGVNNGDARKSTRKDGKTFGLHLKRVREMKREK